MATLMLAGQVVANMNGEYEIATGTKLAPKFNDNVRKGSDQTSLCRSP